ncbi:alkaline phosphatase, partial [Pseudomonas aeruginosa]
LYPEDNGQVVDFSQHAGLSAAYIELKAVRQSIADKEKREAELKQMLQQAMGDASRAEFANGYITWRKAKDSVGFDVAQLLKDKPYLQAK